MKPAVYIENSNGSKIEACGTPEVIEQLSKCELSRITLWVRLLK